MPERSNAAAILAALTAYGLWGVFPLYFRMLEAVPSHTIVAHRFIWSFLFLFGAFLLLRKWGSIKTAFRDKEILGRAFLAGLLLISNWVVYIWAINEHRVLEASFGYFINPIVSVAIAYLFLKERVSKIQYVAIAIACIGIAVQAIAIQGVPWISLFLALSFAFYGYLRKTINLGSASGLLVEVTTCLPLALGAVLYFGFKEGWHVQLNAHDLPLLIMTGPITALPLIAFAYGARRLRLTTIGMLQYISPSIKFLLAITVLGETVHMPQLASFTLVWVALVVFSFAGLNKNKSAAVPEA